MTRPLAVLAAVAVAAGLAVAPHAAGAVGPTPMLAYYYIWFDATSWSRAKRDYPLAGRYSSDESRVVARQIRQARRAGIDGFIVSWKHTPVLDRRLAEVMRIADEQHFKLAIIYEGLDFHRRPLPVSRVASDLSYFAGHFAGNAAFRLFDKPLAIWSGTWKFSAADVRRATEPVRARLLVLASEKNVRGYRRLARFVDGDAYYWSSVDPATYPRYPQKLADLSATVHGNAGLWIAPAAPGFDARLIGGTRVVDRENGATLRRELEGALASGPDAIGVISWNEYSENSEVEPSLDHGYRSLQVIAAFRGLGSRFPSSVDSSSSPAGGGRSYGPAVLLAVAALALLATVLLGGRLRRRGGPARIGAGPPARRVSGRRPSRSR